MITKLVVKYLYGKMVSSTKQKASMTVNHLTITPVHANDTIRVECGSKLERLNVRRVTPFLNNDLNFRNLVCTFHITLTLVVFNQKLFTHTMSLPLGGFFLLTEVFFPAHADSSFMGASDMSTEVHCNLCNYCYTLGMPDPRPDITCIQYLPKVHYKVPNTFLAPSGTSDIID